MTSAVPRIFVSIAVYRDPECQWTVKDLFEKAALPDRVSVGLCWQYLAGEDDDCFLFRTRRSQCRVIECSALDSLGACWARHQVQTLWQGEEYFLQIDSHMRFEPDWDEKLLAMIASCPSQRPILSTYPPGYTPPDALQRGSFPAMLARHFDSAGVLGLHSQLISLNQAPPRPVANPFCSGGLLFTPSAAIREVPYDPHLYFTGEEITLAVRFWTHGWDIFTPNDNIVYHDYGHARRRHWQDNKQWGALSIKAARRLRHLLRMETCTDADVLKDLDRYGLGTARTLESFEEVSGVNFRSRTIEPRPVGPPWNDGPLAPLPTPTAAPTPLQRARALVKEGKDEAAIVAFDQALAATPTLADAAYGKANALLRLKRYQAAADCYQQASHEAVYRSEALYGRGIALDCLGRWAEAAQALEAAVAARPEIHYLRLLAWVYYRGADLDNAEAVARRIIVLAPDDADAHFALAVSLISGGRAQGWAEYEWRWKRPSLQPLFRHGGLEQWRGGPIAGRHALLWAEQGLGDEIMFARYLPPAVAAAGAATVECDARMAPLLSRAWPAARVVARGTGTPPGPDLACPFGSLPMATGLGFETLPYPFLGADPERRAALRRALKRDDTLLVALSWRTAPAGGAHPKSLKDWAPLLAVPGVRFVSVQAGAGAAELALADGAVDPVPDLDVEQDLDGLAAVLSACDLHIGVDAVPAHLAGALGTEAWVLLPHRADWRWPLTGDTSRVYPSLRLLRQDRPDDWPGLLTRTAQALTRRATEATPS